MPSSHAQAARTSESDRFFDYCLRPYRPRRAARGKLRAEYLLFEALEVAGLFERTRAVLHALRDSLGRDRVVWGVRHDGERLSFELRVVDPRGAASVRGLAETLAGVLAVRPRVREAIPYSAIGFVLDQATFEAGAIAELTLHVAGGDEREGVTYLATEQGAQLSGSYRFFEPKPDVDDMLGLVKSSCFIDYSEPRTLGHVLVPELYCCKRICVEKRRTRDALTYTGISIDHLLAVLRRLGYPSRLVEVASHVEADLDHLYFDVCVELEQDRDGTIRYPLACFYGTY